MEEYTLAQLEEMESDTRELLTIIRNHAQIGEDGKAVLWHLVRDRHYDHFYRVFKRVDTFYNEHYKGHLPGYEDDQLPREVDEPTRTRLLGQLESLAEGIKREIKRRVAHYEIKLQEKTLKVRWVNVILFVMSLGVSLTVAILGYLHTSEQKQDMMKLQDRMHIVDLQQTQRTDQLEALRKEVELLRRKFEVTQQDAWLDKLFRRRPYEKTMPPLQGGR